MLSTLLACSKNLHTTVFFATRKALDQFVAEYFPCSRVHEGGIWDYCDFDIPKDDKNYNISLRWYHFTLGNDFQYATGNKIHGVYGYHLFLKDLPELKDPRTHFVDF